MEALDKGARRIFRVMMNRLRFCLWLTLLVGSYTECHAREGALHPASEFWINYAKENYSLIFEPTTELALLQASGHTYPIETTLAPRSFIWLTKEQSKYRLHLTDIYEDEKIHYQYDITAEDADLLFSFFEYALEQLTPRTEFGLDGRSYFFRVSGAKNEYGYTWSPKEFTFSSDIRLAMQHVRDDCLRCIEDKFDISQKTQQFFKTVEITPDSLRQKYIDLKSKNRETAGPIDPFGEVQHEQLKAKKDQRIAGNYRLLQLSLQYEEERLELLRQYESGLK